jgi:hypothetical protein
MRFGLGVDAFTSSLLGKSLQPNASAEQPEKSGESGVANSLQPWLTQPPKQRVANPHASTRMCVALPQIVLTRNLPAWSASPIGWAAHKRVSINLKMAANAHTTSCIDLRRARKRLATLSLTQLTASQPDGDI